MENVVQDVKAEVEKIGTEIAKAEKAVVAKVEEVAKKTEAEVAVTAVAEAEKVLAEAKAKALLVKEKLEKEWSDKSVQINTEIHKLEGYFEGKLKAVETDVEQEVVKGEKEVSNHPLLSAVIVFAIGVIIGAVVCYFIR